MKTGLPLLDWRPPAPPEPEVVPLPLTRRPGFVMKHARYAASLRREKAEQYIARQLAIQADKLDRWGVRPEVARREIVALESAIRKAWGNLVYAPQHGGGVA